MRLPSRVYLPFGYRISVKLVTDSEMGRALGTPDPDELVDGLWDDDSRTIFIRKSIPKRRQRYILWHEMLHAVLDASHDSLNSEAAKP